MRAGVLLNSPIGALGHVAAVVAHGDLDGLASAAVIIAAFRKSKGIYPKLLIAQPYVLHRTLLRLLSAPPRLVVITDVGVDEAVWPSVSRSLEDLVAKGVKILWIDHHIQTARVSLDLAELGVSLLYTSSGCASSIAREVFAPLTDDPSFYAKLARLGEIADNVAVGDRELMFLADRLVAALSAPSSKEEFKAQLVRMWVEERKFVNDEVAIKAEEFEKALALKLAEIKQRIVFEGERGLLVDARDIKLGGLAGHIASRLARERGKIAIVVFSPNEREVVATCRVPPDAEFNAVVELAPIAADLGGGGGGLSRAAAVRVPSSSGEQLLKRLREALTR